jgi:hypothetical protein
LNRRSLLLIVWLIAIAADAHAVQDETPDQRRQKVLSPSRSPNYYSVSLEWVIDASDVIVEAKLNAKKEPEQVEVYKQATDRMFDFPPGDADRWRAICELYEPDDKVIFFLWHDADAKTWKIFDYIPLLTSRVREERQRISESLAPPEEGTQERMFHYLRERDAGLHGLAIEKGGRWIGDQAAVLDIIEQRVKAGSRIPPGADREAVLNRESTFGGFYSYVPQKPNLSSDEFPCLLLPPDPEYREYYLKVVSSSTSHEGQLEAFSRIGNYKDAEVIAALKSRFDDNLVHEVFFAEPGHGLRRSVFFIMTSDTPPMQLEPNIVGTRTFILRKAAWEALQQMGEKVDPPELNAK